MADPSAAPSGPLPPNFFDAKPLANYASTILGVTIPLLICCWLAISTRLYARYIITKTPGWDDLFIVLALLVITMGTIAFCISPQFGMGHHIYIIAATQPKHLSKFLVCHYLDAAAYNCSTALIKLSLLFQYLRVFERGTKTYRFTQFLLILTALWGTMFGFMAWFPCFPPSNLYNMKPKPNHCYAVGSSDTTTVIHWIEAHAGSNVIMDVLVWALAFRLLFTKDAPTTKSGMYVLLFMGVVSAGTGIWRLEEIVRNKAGVSEDLSWNLAGPTLLSFSEIYVACLSASTPFFWPIFTAQFNKIFVTYEFNVSTESRYHDDDIELAPSKSGMTVDSRSMDSGLLTTERKPTQYTDDYVQHNVDPFAQEFRTDTAIHTNAPGKKKGTNGNGRLNGPG